MEPMLPGLLPLPPTRSPGLPSRSGAERLKGGRRNGPALPFQRPHFPDLPQLVAHRPKKKKKQIADAGI